MKCRALTQKGIRCKRNSDPNTNNYGFCKIHQYYSAVDTYWFNSLRELCPPINATIMEYIKFLDQFYVISPYFELHKITGATKFIYSILLKSLNMNPTKEQLDKLIFYRKLFFWNPIYYFNTNTTVTCSHCLNNNAYETLCCGLYQCELCFMKKTKCECGFRH